jgi:GGDEF domain-containing protein
MKIVLCLDKESFKERNFPLVAATLRGMVRMGGDEFILVLPETALGPARPWQRACVPPSTALNSMPRMAAGWE